MTTIPTASIAPMQIATSRFGVLDALDEQVIEVQGGLLGFPDATHYVQIPVIDADGWIWLQSIDDPELAFLSITVFRFFPDYDIELSPTEAEALGLEEVSDATVLALVTIGRSDTGTIEAMTANLLGPVVVNEKKSIARQVVLADGGYSTSEPVAG